MEKNLSVSWDIGQDIDVECEEGGSRTDAHLYVGTHDKYLRIF